MAEGDTLLNALIGGVVAFVVSFVPFSPVLGGAVAGYLQGGTRNDGLRVGALSGAVMAVPLVLLGGGILVVTTFLAPAADPGIGLGIVAIVFLALVGLIVGGLYTVGLGALGGWLGNYVRYDTDLMEERQPVEVDR